MHKRLYQQFLLKRLQHAPKVVGWVYTMILVLISWVIFASVDGQGGLGYFASMFGLRVGETANVGGVPFLNSTTLYLLRNYGIMLILCAVGATPLPARLAGKVRNWLSGGAAFNEEVTEASAKSPAEAPAAGSTAWQVLWSLAAMAMFVVCTAYLVDATYNPFLYFRF